MKRGELGDRVCELGLEGEQLALLLLNLQEESSNFIYLSIYI